MEYIYEIKEQNVLPPAPRFMSNFLSPFTITTPSNCPPLSEPSETILSIKHISKELKQNWLNNYKSYYYNYTNYFCTFRIANN